MSNNITAAGAAFEDMETTGTTYMHVEPDYSVEASARIHPGEIWMIHTGKGPIPVYVLAVLPRWALVARVYRKRSYWRGVRVTTRVAVDAGWIDAGAVRTAPYDDRWIAQPAEDEYGKLREAPDVMWDTTETLLQIATENAERAAEADTEEA